MIQALIADIFEKPECKINYYTSALTIKPMRRGIIKWLMLRLY
jgi:hypothetical protein